MGRQQIKCHGSPERFEEVAGFVYDRFGASIKYIGDIAGGQGALTRILNKKYNYNSEVIDPRGYALKGVANRAEKYEPAMASYYDLIIGLHPDEATRAVVESALTTPVLVVPCCNFWDLTQKLGSRELVAAIEKYFIDNKIQYESIQFNFKGPKNIGLLTKF